jgi:hypothetical protein
VWDVGERRGDYRVLLGKPERKNAHGKPRIEWKDNIKMDLNYVDWGECGDGLD